ncbi:MAG: DUF1569 domain-containing protein [Gemmatimonadaceae bacterium]|nr:DUF1569 domain-containing protein [Gemmatimonadaceae bacterium]
MPDPIQTLFDRQLADALIARTERLRANPPALWGRMTAAQAAAHCADAIEVACGDRRQPRMMVGRLLGWLIKPLALGDAKPLRRNAPTTPDLVIQDDRDIETERARLCAQIDRFVTAGPAGCTTHPHPFFGPLTPHEWAVLHYKHVDHHLRQFGA